MHAGRGGKKQPSGDTVRGIAAIRSRSAAGKWVDCVLDQTLFMGYYTVKGYGYASIS